MLLERITVCYDPTKFMGFPANAGLWSWENEILAAFHVGVYDDNAHTHKIDMSKPITTGLARSLDEGKSWMVEWDNEINRLGNAPPIPLPSEGIHFAHPDFALKVGKSGIRIQNDTFVVSYDRGYTWQGPYKLPGYGEYELTARTDYVVDSDSTCLLFLSRVDSRIPCVRHPDHAYAVKTEDGGRTWKELGFLADLQGRSVMPYTVRMSDGRFITALSRRKDVYRGAKNRSTPPIGTEDWVEVRESVDGGKTWTFLSRIEATWPIPYLYGNPVAISRLPDGRLVIFFAQRTEENAKLSAVMSSDGGHSWQEEQVLADGFCSSDMGYPQVATLRFGKMVIVLYGATQQMPRQHIEAIRWLP